MAGHTHIPTPLGDARRTPAERALLPFQRFATPSATSTIDVAVLSRKRRSWLTTTTAPG